MRNFSGREDVVATVGGTTESFLTVIAPLDIMIGELGSKVRIEKNRPYATVEKIARPRPTTQELIATHGERAAQ